MIFAIMSPSFRLLTASWRNKTSKKSSISFLFCAIPGVKSNSKLSCYINNLAEWQQDPRRQHRGGLHHLQEPQHHQVHCGLLQQLSLHHHHQDRVETFALIKPRDTVSSDDLWWLLIIREKRGQGRGGKITRVSLGSSLSSSSSRWAAWLIHAERRHRSTQTPSRIEHFLAELFT